MIAPLVAALSMGGPLPAAAAMPPLLIDDAGLATDCGSYTGQPATIHADAAAAISNAASGTTVLVCPGEHTLAENIIITGRSKLTIRRAVPGTGDLPIFKISNSATNGLNIVDSNVSIDGLVIDAGTNLVIAYAGINLSRSSAKIKNVMVIGPNELASVGIAVNAEGQTAVKTVSVSASTIAGFRDNGIRVSGPARLNLTSSYLDGTDGSRLPSSSRGVLFLSTTEKSIISKSTFANSNTGITVDKASNIKLTGNIFQIRVVGIRVASYGASNADNVQIVGNTFLVSEGNKAIEAEASSDTTTMKKLLISKNSFYAAQSMAGTFGVWVDAYFPLTTTVTLAGNSFLGFNSTTSEAVSNQNTNAVLTFKSNTIIP
jgi:hypothetical protein